MNSGHAVCGLRVTGAATASALTILGEFIMKRKFLGSAIACAVLCSCASTSTPVANLGTAAPANPVLANLNAVNLERQEHEQERASLLQKIQELGNELAQLKGTKTQSGSEIVAKPLPIPNSVAMVQPIETAASNRNKLKKLKVMAVAEEPVETNRETIVIQDSGMVFRVMHGFAKTEFHPSKALQQQLLQAARAGKRIEIRGRTDATKANEIDREIALQRALNARVFLANNGIHPSKMHINYMSAGDNVADNSTTEGRARNRRVDIETAGITPDVLEAMASVIRQELQ